MFSNPYYDSISNIKCEKSVSDRPVQLNRTIQIIAIILVTLFREKHRTFPNITLFPIH